ncbi:hypothetical protein SAMN05421741_10143 [Paenimyroides ummariense]|uniref:Outer membrane protein beta-barrel domain-containing protein n=1 Tax=Paenimyroides ummariense TaxID=913024 RepID=A0A1I4W3E7_9FLAO|nr:hypothetical protein [Paenimyroides ummariense]SFN08003.1 hypothetical protein SAMN05421741_10143 [Paenimyroides ummariense]
MKHLVLLSTLLFAQITFAQSQQNDLAVTIGATTMPAFNKNKIGLDLTGRYYFTDAFSGGLSLNIVSPKYNHGFGFDTDRTLINMYSFSIPLQYDVVNTEKLTLSFGFSNGILLNILRNRNESNEVINYDPDTGIGYTTQVPRKLKTDSYYTLTPYADVSYRLMAMDIEEIAFMFLTSKVGYRNVFGNGSFSKPSDFSNYVVSLGITFKGVLD